MTAVAPGVRSTLARPVAFASGSDRRERPREFLTTAAFCSVPVDGRSDNIRDL
jgi:hypothetical protein